MGRRDRVVVLCQSLMQQVPITIEAAIASRGEMYNRCNFICDSRQVGGLLFFGYSGFIHQ